MLIKRSIYTKIVTTDRNQLVETKRVSKSLSVLETEKRKTSRVLK